MEIEGRESDIERGESKRRSERERERKGEI